MQCLAYIKCSVNVSDLYYFKHRADDVGFWLNTTERLTFYHCLYAKNLSLGSSQAPLSYGHQSNSSNLPTFSCRHHSALVTSNYFICNFWKATSSFTPLRGCLHCFLGLVNYLFAKIQLSLNHACTVLLHTQNLPLFSAHQSHCTIINGR